MGCGRCAGGGRGETPKLPFRKRKPAKVCVFRCSGGPDRKVRANEPETGWNASDSADTAAVTRSTTMGEAAAVGEWAGKMVIAAKSNAWPRIKIRRRIHVPVVWVSAVRVSRRGVNIGGRTGVVVPGADHFGRIGNRGRRWRRARIGRSWGIGLSDGFRLGGGGLLSQAGSALDHGTDDRAGDSVFVEVDNLVSVRLVSDAGAFHVSLNHRRIDA